MAEGKNKLRAVLDRLVGLPVLLLGTGLERLGLGQHFPALGLALLITLFPGKHEILDRFIQQEVQAAGQNDEVQQVQQYLLPINVQRHCVLPPFTGRTGSE